MRLKAEAADVFLLATELRNSHFENKFAEWKQLAVLEKKNC